MRVIDLVKDLIEIPCGKIVRHAEVHIEIIAAVFWARPRNFALEITDKFIHFNHERHDVFGRKITGNKEIETRPASHGTKVDDFAFVFFVVAQEGCTKVFDRMDFCCIHDRLVIWRSHAKVKGGDGFIADMIFARYINAWH